MSLIRRRDFYDVAPLFLYGFQDLLAKYTNETYEYFNPFRNKCDVNTKAKSDLLKTCMEFEANSHSKKRVNIEGTYPRETCPLFCTVHPRSPFFCYVALIGGNSNMTRPTSQKRDGHIDKEEEEETRELSVFPTPIFRNEKHRLYSSVRFPISTGRM